LIFFVAITILIYSIRIVFCNFFCGYFYTSKKTSFGRGWKLDIKQKKTGLPDGGDPLVDGVIMTREFFRKNGTTIASVVVAVIIIAGGAFFYNNARETRVKKAQELFGVAILDYNAGNSDMALEVFRKVANDYRQTQLGTMSAFMMGSIYLDQKNADNAATWFEVAVNGPDAGFVKGQALEGLAAAQEEKGDIPSAVRNLERALKDKNAAHRHNAIRWRLALLNKGDADAVGRYCRELIADTLATAFHQKAENLLASANAAK
jgi:hypothetical protein